MRKNIDKCQALEKYNRIHSFLLLVRRTQRDLHQLWSEAMLRSRAGRQVVCFPSLLLIYFIFCVLGRRCPGRGSNKDTHGLPYRQPAILPDGRCAGHQDDRLHRQVGEVHQLWGGEALPRPIFDGGASQHLPTQPTGKGPSIYYVIQILGPERHPPPL